MGLASKIARLGRRMWHCGHDAPLESHISNWRACRVEELEPRQLMSASSLSGQVYEDQMGPGAYQLGDTLVAGASLQLLNQSNNVVASTTTGTNGQYQFQNVESGTYTLHLVQPAGSLEGNAYAGSLGGLVSDANDIGGVTVGVGQTGASYNFYVVEPNIISGAVKVETTSDWDTNPADPALPGVTVDLMNSAGSVISTAQTDSNGDYSFTNLYTGTYSVRAVVPSGYLAGHDQVGNQGGTANGGNEIDGVFVMCGNTGVNYDFSMIRPNSVSGTVELEPSPGNQTNPADTPVANVTVELLDGHGNLLATTATNTSGQYTFQNLLPGTYEVREMVPGDYTAGDIEVGSDGGTANGLTETDSVGLQNGANGVNYNFYLIQPSSVAGIAYIDQYNTGVYQAGDTLLSGVTIELLDQEQNILATTTTGANGAYQFGGLTPGVYSIRQIQPAGYLTGGDNIGSLGGAAPDADDLTQVSLAPNQNGVNYNFYVIQPDSIGGYVKIQNTPDWDTNPANPPLAGVTLSLENSKGTVIATTTTDANGQYTFNNLYPGTYSVVETVPSPYFASADQLGSQGGVLNGLTEIDDIVLVCDANGTHYDFAVVPPDSISGHVKWDEYGPCSEFPNDPGLAGVTVQLLNSSGTVINATTTDANGDYSFTQLFPGTYSVREIVPTGYWASEDEVGDAGGVTNGLTELDNANLVGGINAVNYNFCVIPPNSIAGVVKVETTPDWETNSSDPVLPGVTIQLLDASGNIVATQQTNASGAYDFQELMPGTYSVREIVPANYFASDDHVGSLGGTANGLTALNSVVLLGGVNGVHYDFAVVPPDSISGDVKWDEFGPCNLFPNDPGLAGVTIELLNSTGSVVNTTTTDVNGDYSFGNLYPGTYSVREILPPGYFAGLDEVGDAGGVTNGQTELDDANLVGGINAVNYNFCVVPPNSIAGIVKVETTPDWETNSSDPLLPGVTIQLLDSSGTVVNSAVTDAKGAYSFQELLPGTYEVRETVPGGYLASDDHVGSLGGAANGFTDLGSITLLGGVNGVHYDFAVVPPGSISGVVKEETTSDWDTNPADPPIAGVTIQLLNASQQVIATTQTNADGQYSFTNLLAGTYSVVETVPPNYFASDDHVGSVGGTANGLAALDTINLPGGANGVHYDFALEPPDSISGHVKLAVYGDCATHPNDPGLAGITIQLVDANNTVEGTTTTDANGNFSFNGLHPGVYSLHEVVPAGFIPDDDMVGTAGGVTNGFTELDNISLVGGISAQDYYFCLSQQSTIEGIVFQDGPAIQSLPGSTTAVTAANSGRTGVYQAGDPLIAGVTLVLGDANGNILYGSNGKPIETTTDANGAYAFTGLLQGTYTVYELPPGGYIVGLETAGSTGGVALNPGVATPAGFVGNSATAIAQITVANNQTSYSNNFSVLLAQSFFIPPPNPGIPAIPNTIVTNPLAPPTAFVQQQIVPAPGPVSFYSGGGGDGYTWHLSVVNAGQPRGSQVQLTAQQRELNDSWETNRLTESEWVLSGEEGQPPRQFAFGMRDGTPIVGDFNGDGTTDVGVFKDGQWFIDLNGNGVWDKEDLWAKLGYRDDLPITGDWDGDGKADIGIYGKAWGGDPRAIANEPGLPDPDNKNAGVRKNLAKRETAPHGWRTMQRTSTGSMRNDLIDHVFHYGTPGDQPIAGDWNGAGVDTIGIFRDGRWDLDVDGNGKWSAGDKTFQMGAHGDIPVVGDFDGDGRDDLGIYRAGTWHIDVNADRVLDHRDLTVKFGDDGDLPVVGDFNGDGREEMGVYRNGRLMPAKTALMPPADGPK